jgi:hypothetical protein
MRSRQPIAATWATGCRSHRPVVGHRNGLFATCRYYGQLAG